MLRSIVHLDADAFFASVEQAADTRLRGKPIPAFCYECGKSDCHCQMRSRGLLRNTVRIRA